MSRADERLVFVDVETVGTVKNPRIIQVAAIATDRNANEIAGFEAKAKLPKAARTKPKHSRYCHDRWEAEGRDAKVVAAELSAFLIRNATVERFSKSGQLFRVAQLVAHNATFDGEVLRNWFSQHGVFCPASFQTLCTLQRAMWLFQEKRSMLPPADYRLITLCKHFGIVHTKKQAHDAFADVRATVLLYRKMNEANQCKVVDVENRCTA